MFILFGPPGAGKSTLGSALAHKLALPFFDIDVMIEDRLGLTRCQAWETLGEKRYREIEAQIVKTLQKGIIACGGGTVLDAQNLSHLQTLGQMVYLICQAPLLIQRYFSTPRAQLKTKEAYLALLEQRIPHYENIKAIRIDSTASINAQIKNILTLYI